MKKKILSAIAATLILAVCIVCLVACNPYKMDAIGGGDASAKVESNGGYVVKQGNYVYFINGYVGADADATWGAATKQGIVRAEYKDGKSTIALPKCSFPRVFTTLPQMAVSQFSVNGFTMRRPTSTKTKTALLPPPTPTLCAPKSTVA